MRARIRFGQARDQPAPESAETMKRNAAAQDMRREYGFDYSKAVRGKYYRRILKEGR